MPEAPIHLRPAAELAERVLLPGDPHRALHVAQALLDKPLMFNHHRGLWGYTGTARDGSPLTVQATGMGGPSAAIVTEELIGLGATTFIRIGTCGALVDELQLGELLPVEAALAADGASSALGADGRVAADAHLTTALSGAAKRPAVTCVSTDLFYDAREDLPNAWKHEGAALVEMEAAAVLQVAARHDARAGCLLAVTDQLAKDERVRASFDAVAAMGTALGETAWEALELVSR
ncbi:MAG: purine-nucleoside phosphorylase [Gaiellaceae bacterium]